MKRLAAVFNLAGAVSLVALAGVACNSTQIAREPFQDAAPADASSLDAPATPPDATSDAGAPDSSLMDAPTDSVSDATPDVISRDAATGDAADSSAVGITAYVETCSVIIGTRAFAEHQFPGMAATYIAARLVVYAHYIDAGAYGQPRPYFVGGGTSVDDGVADYPCGSVANGVIYPYLDTVTFVMP
jgi:hypothetical protein